MHYPMVGLYLLSELSSYALPNGRPVPAVKNDPHMYPHMHYPMVGLYLLSELSSYALPNGRPVPAV